MKPAVLWLIFDFITVLALILTETNCRNVNNIKRKREDMEKLLIGRRMEINEDEIKLKAKSNPNATIDRFFDQQVNHFDRLNINNTWKQVKFYP